MVYIKKRIYYISTVLTVLVFLINNGNALWTIVNVHVAESELQICSLVS